MKIKLNKAGHNFYKLGNSPLWKQATIMAMAVSNCIFKWRPRSATQIFLKVFEVRVITVVKTKQFYIFWTAAIYETKLGKLFIEICT